MIGYIHSYESFGTVDGPGIRFVIFLQGCPLRCLYCHNPDTWSIKGGKPTTVEEIVKQVKKYRNYLQGGGVTVSGGEPLLQIEFVTELFAALKAEGIHTAIDTTGFTFDRDHTQAFDDLLTVTDLVLLDLKHIDEKKHIELTGKSNRSVLEFANYLAANNKPAWIRHVLVPGLTDDRDDLANLRAFIDTLANVERVEVLPYHSLGEIKYQRLGLRYHLAGQIIPSNAQIMNVEAILAG